MNKTPLGIGAAILVVLASGCGGSGAAGGPGEFGIAIKWPTQRVIPELTQTMDIRVVGPGVNQEQSIPKPTNGAANTNVQFTGLPVGQQLIVQCNAYGAPVNGHAPLLGIAETPVTLGAATGTSVTLDLQSTIEQLTLTGKDLSGGTLTLPANTSSTLTVTAYSTATAVVPIGPGNLTFTSTGSGFTMTPSGNIVKVTAGAGAATGTITATESESGKATSIVVSG